VDLKQRKSKECISIFLWSIKYLIFRDWAGSQKLCPRLCCLLDKWLSLWYVFHFWWIFEVYYVAGWSTWYLCFDSKTNTVYSYAWTLTFWREKQNPNSAVIKSWQQSIPRWTAFCMKYKKASVFSSPSLAN